MIEFGKNEDNMLMMPMDLDNLLQTVWIWSEKSNLLSNRMPKNFVELTKFNLLFLIRIFGWPVKSLLENTVYEDLLTLRESLFAHSQVSILFNSSFKKSTQFIYRVRGIKNSTVIGEMHKI